MLAATPGTDRARLTMTRSQPRPDVAGDLANRILLSGVAGLGNVIILGGVIVFSGVAA